MRRLQRRLNSGAAKAALTGIADPFFTSVVDVSSLQQIYGAMVVRMGPRPAVLVLKALRQHHRLPRRHQPD
jgi:hypothetical protein